MKRKLMDDLVLWKDKNDRKPLVLYGARQVGKTWLLHEFGRQCFQNTVYLDFDNNPELQGLFNLGYDLEQLISDISNMAHQNISEGETLLIFDEVQECPFALTSLKYFCEQMPKLHVVAAGSLLGLVDHVGTGFPVGKVNFLTLYPMSFTEFLDATDNSNLKDVIFSANADKLKVFSERLKLLLKQYYIVGGMPEAVSSYIKNDSFDAARGVQQEILDGYRLDITKHLEGKDIEKVLAVWDSIPAHLSQENRKFVFGHIADGARARDYRSAVTWLENAGITIRVPRISVPNIPLSAYKDGAAFKLFFNDIGLLGAMAKLDPTSVLTTSSAFKEFKGAFSEQYVAQQLLSELSAVPYYWSAENSRGEIDFLVQDAEDIFAIEVKSEENLRSKSLRFFSEKYKHVKPLRFSLSDFRKQDWMRNVPLYSIACKKFWL